MFSTSDLDEKYAEPRLPTFEEALTQERLEKERANLVEATKQLSRIQLDMEAKIRQEMEARIRQEMEEKIRNEIVRMEEEQRATEAKRALEAMIDERHEKVVKEYAKITQHYQSQSSTFAEYFSSITTFLTTHRVLYKESGNTTSMYPSETLGGGFREAYFVFVTEEYLGLHYYITSNSGVSHSEIHPLYHFDQQLTLRDLKILDQLIDGMPCGKKTRSSLTGQYVEGWMNWSIVTGIHPLNSQQLEKTPYSMLFGASITHTPHRTPVPSGLLTTFDSVLRLIPGSYRNGPWRPLDGLLGMYYNQETSELHVGPPPMV